MILSPKLKGHGYKKKNSSVTKCVSCEIIRTGHLIRLMWNITFLYDILTFDMQHV